MEAVMDDEPLCREKPSLEERKVKALEMIAQLLERIANQHE